MHPENTGFVDGPPCRLTHAVMAVKPRADASAHGGDEHLPCISLPSHLRSPSKSVRSWNLPHCWQKRLGRPSTTRLIILRCWELRAGEGRMRMMAVMSMRSA